MNGRAPDAGGGVPSLFAGFDGLPGGSRLIATRTTTQTMSHGGTGASAAMHFDQLKSLALSMGMAASAGAARKNEAESKAQAAAQKQAELEKQLADKQREVRQPLSLPRAKRLPRAPGARTDWRARSWRGRRRCFRAGAQASRHHDKNAAGAGPSERQAAGHLHAVPVAAEHDAEDPLEAQDRRAPAAPHDARSAHRPRRPLPTCVRVRVRSARQPPRACHLPHGPQRSEAWLTRRRSTVEVRALAMARDLLDAQEAAVKLQTRNEQLTAKNKSELRAGARSPLASRAVCSCRAESLASWLLI
jgi:hypothetical protein